MSSRPGQALLDWETATITLPIDEYGMSPKEAQLIDAAASIEWARCVTGSPDVPVAVVQEAARSLTVAPLAEHGLYGGWDAAYLARYGWDGDVGIPVSFMEYDWETAQKCRAALDAAGLRPISVIHATTPESRILNTGSMDAYARTLENPEYLVLRAAWTECIRQQGYGVDDSRQVGGLAFDPAWDDEQTLDAVLVEATCADDMNYTQQVGDINASLQMAYIAEHQAELVATRQECDRRLATAHEVLRSAGAE